MEGGRKEDSGVIKGPEEARERPSRQSDELGVRERDRAGCSWGQGAMDALRPGGLTVPYRESPLFGSSFSGPNPVLGAGQLQMC